MAENFLSPSTMLPRPNHRRSGSSGNGSRSPARRILKARSTNDLLQTVHDRRSRSAVSDLDGVPETDFSTLKDPRLASSSDLSESGSSPTHHPDLNSEVATLSAKLVQAINNQTTLDDTLAATKQELEKARERLRELELENEKYRKDVADEVLVKKSDVDSEISQLKAGLAEEKAQRIIAEKDKKNIEQELETLTAALFEEANKMVAAAKHEREAVEKKNEQLRLQIQDTELLLASHQEQLSELKLVMHGLDAVKEDADARTAVSTGPVSPAVSHAPSNLGKTPDMESCPEPELYTEEVQPGPPTTFPNFCRMVYRTDVQAYEEFHELLVQSKASKPPSRATSATYSGLNVMGLAALTGASSSSTAANSPSKTSQAHSPSGSLSSPHSTTSHPPLKDARLYKRILLEDIEPTLRLDSAPAISWLTRRAVLSGICEGSLVVEPTPSAYRKFNFGCSLCGERRTGSLYERTHRFMTSDSESAQRYPLCGICLEKVRSCCEMTGYLRLILDGHVRTGDVEEERDAWEEIIRLRERMFWSRICGGVVPLVNRPKESPQSSPAGEATDKHSPNGERPETSSSAQLDGSNPNEVDDVSPPKHGGFATAPSELPPNGTADPSLRRGADGPEDSPGKLEAISGVSGNSSAEDSKESTGNDQEQSTT